MRIKSITTIALTLLFIALFSGCGNESNTVDSVAQTPESIEETTQSNSNIILRSHINNNTIELFWDANPKAVSYQIEWGENPDALYNIEYIDAKRTTYLSSELQEKSIYYFRLVTYLGDNKESLYSKLLALKTGESKKLIQSDTAI